MDAASQIAHLAEPAAQAAGLVVDAVEIAAAGKHTRVLVTVDLPETEVGSAPLDAVAQASRGIGAALDAADYPKGPYTLEVSTPGLDRPLTERRHFLRARTRLVSLQLRDGTVVEGRLSDVVDDVLVVDQAGERTEVALGDVDGGRIEIDWKAQSGLTDEGDDGFEGEE